MSNLIRVFEDFNGGVVGIVNEMNAKFKELEDLASSAEGNYVFIWGPKSGESSFVMECYLKDISNPTVEDKEWTLNGRSCILFENGERVDIGSHSEGLEIIEQAVRGTIR